MKLLCKITANYFTSNWEGRIQHEMNILQPRTLHIFCHFSTSLSPLSISQPPYSSQRPFNHHLLFLPHPPSDTDPPFIYRWAEEAGYGVQISDQNRFDLNNINVKCLKRMPPSKIMVQQEANPAPSVAQPTSNVRNYTVLSIQNDNCMETHPHDTMSSTMSGRSTGIRVNWPD